MLKSDMGGRRKSSAYSRDRIKARATSARKARLKEYDKKYPLCTLLFPECPQAIEDLKNPPEICKECENFLGSKYAEQAEEQKKNDFLETIKNLQKNQENKTE